MLGLLTSDFAYQNRMTLLQHLIDCGDVLLGKQYVYGLDNRISHSRSSASPDVVNKDLGLSESDDETPATTTRLEPELVDIAVSVNKLIPSILSPIGSGGSPSSGSESSPSDSESESSSAESTDAPPPAPAPPPAQRTSWGLSNFVPPPAQPPDHPEPYAAGKELRHALDDVKGKPSPISEMSDSETSSPSPGAARRRRSVAARVSTASSDEETTRPHHQTRTQPSPASATNTSSTGAVKRGRPSKQRAEERPAKRKRGRPPKSKQLSPPPPAAPAAPPPPPPAAPAAPAPADSDPELEPATHALDTKTFIFRKSKTCIYGRPPIDPPLHTEDSYPKLETPADALGNKTFIFRKVFTPKKSDEYGGKGGKGGKGKGGKGKGQVTIIEVTPPESGDDDRRHRERSDERRNEEAIARVSPPREPETVGRRSAHERSERPERPERISDRIADRIADRYADRTTNDRLPPDRTERHAERIPNDPVRLQPERLQPDRLQPDRAQPPADRPQPTDRRSIERFQERLQHERIAYERLQAEKMAHERLQPTVERMATDRLPNQIGDKLDRLAEKRERLSGDKSHDRLAEKMAAVDCLPGDKVSLDRVNATDRIVTERSVRAEADVGSGLKSGRGSERLEDATSNGRGRARMLVRIALSRLRSDTLRALQRPARRAPAPRVATPPPDQGVEVMEALGGAGGGGGRSPVYYSYFEQLPPDTLSDDDRDHTYYMDEAKRMRSAAESEQEPLARVMLYHESVLCFVLTGRLLEMEMDTKKAFTIYRETIEYIKSIHSMPQRFRTSPKSPHSTFSKLDILSLRVQALLYLRMFRMYNREVKEYNKVVQEYQQKPACAEPVSPMSPTPSGGSLLSAGPGSAGSGCGSGSGSNGYCSLVHSVPAHAHHALLQLTKYYTFLYVAHELWEQADILCRLRPNQDLFIAVDRKCGPLTLFSTFRHLVQYVRYAMSLLKSAPRE